MSSEENDADENVPFAESSKDDENDLNEIELLPETNETNAEQTIVPNEESDGNENEPSIESSKEENDLNEIELLTETHETNAEQSIVLNEENDGNENEIFTEPQSDVETTPSSNLFLHHFTRVTANQILRSHDHHVISNINRNSSIDIDCIANDHLSLSENLFNFFTPFPLKSTYPLPVIDPWPTSQNVICGRDPVNDLTKQKKEMNRQLYHAYQGRENTLRKSASSKKVAMQMRRKLDRIRLHNKYKKAHKVPYIVYRLASIYETDPDRFFNSHYNWYYTGGCVATASVQNRTILFSARGADCDTLHCVPLKRSSVAPAGFRAKDDHSNFQKCKSPGPIFQVVAQEHPDTAIIGVRQQKNIMIYNCDRNPSESLQLLLSSSEVVPFTNLALSPWTALEMCTLNVVQELHIWDLQTSRSKLVNCSWYKSCSWYDKQSNMQWCGVHYSYQSPDILYLSTDRAVYSVDTKDRYSVATMLGLEQLQHILEPCEIITATAGSTVNSNIQYIGTSHHLFSMDIRQPGQALQCWTHLMHGPPQYIGLSCDMPNREIICLGNTERSELITLVNEWLDEVPYSRTQPYALSSIGETLTEAKIRYGLCLDPKVQSRLKLSLTGISCTSSASPAVFTSTAAGDVFCQRLSPRFANQDEEEEKLAFQARLTYWQEKVMEVENNTPGKPLFFTECKSASRLMKRTLYHQPTEPSENVSESQPVESEAVRPTWVLPTDLLFHSKDDAQAARILKVWGVTDQKSWDRLHSEALAGLPATTVQPGQLVERWLTEIPESQSQHYPDTQETQMSQQFGSQLSTIEHISASQQPSTSHWQQNKPPSETGSDILLQSQMFARRKSGVPKVKKRTDGF